jgi:hypothetical protein
MVVRRAALLAGVVLFPLILGGQGGPVGLPSVPTLAALKATPIAQHKYIQRLGFNAPGDGGGASYTSSTSPCPLNTGNGDNGSQVKPNVGSGCWLANFPNGQANILVFGADPTGVADSMPAIRAATSIASVNSIIIPPGLYACKSLQTAVLPAFNDACVRIHDRNNVSIIADNAQFLADNTHNRSSIFSVETVNNFHWRGGEFIGNRTGLDPSLVNSAFALNSLVNFSIENVNLTGNWGGVSDFSYGDWLVNGYINNISIEKAGQCVDFAFLKGVTLSNFRAKGADASGNQGSGQIGLKCLSIVNDVLCSRKITRVRHSPIPPAMG